MTSVKKVDHEPARKNLRKFLGYLAHNMQHLKVSMYYTADDDGIHFRCGSAKTAGCWTVADIERELKRLA